MKLLRIIGIILLIINIAVLIFLVIKKPAEVYTIDEHLDKKGFYNDLIPDPRLVINNNIE